jgi:serine/threonine protein kinase
MKIESGLFVKCINCQILNSCYNCPKNISYFEATDIMNEETYSYLNLLDYINSDDNLNFKVSDFGYSSSKGFYPMKDFIGTAGYTCPEINEKKTYDGKKADVFALGVIMF